MVTKVNKKPTITIRFDRKKKASSNTVGCVELDVYYDGKRTFISTGVHVKSTEWKNNAVVKRLDAIQLNNDIATLYNKISERLHEMIDIGKVDLSKLTLKESKSNPIDFILWLRSRIEVHPIRESTRKHHIHMADKLEESGIIKTFDDLTPNSIKDWDDYIRTFVSLPATINNYHKRLKVYIAEALQRGYIYTNPYTGFKIERGRQSNVMYLTNDERKKIENLELFGGLEIVKDMFLFSCYTGLAYSDIVKIMQDDVQTINDEKYIIDERLKTGSQYKLKILPPALKILEKYDYDLNRMTNQKCNLYLKVIAMQAGIKKNITMHVGRHTFATWALSQGVKLEVVSKMLAHTDIKTTQIYAKILQEDVDKGFDLLETKL